VPTPVTTSSVSTSTSPMYVPPIITPPAIPGYVPTRSPPVPTRSPPISPTRRFGPSRSPTRRSGPSRSPTRSPTRRFGPARKLVGSSPSPKAFIDPFISSISSNFAPDIYTEEGVKYTYIKNSTYNSNQIFISTPSDFIPTGLTPTYNVVKINNKYIFSPIPITITDPRYISTPVPPYTIPSVDGISTYIKHGWDSDGNALFISTPPEYIPTPNNPTYSVINDGTNYIFTPIPIYIADPTDISTAIPPDIMTSTYIANGWDDKNNINFISTPPGYIPTYDSPTYNVTWNGSKYIFTPNPIA